MKRAKLVYLAGPIHDAIDPHSWRLEIKGMLPRPWQAVIPSDFDFVASAPGIIKCDLNLIKNSDAILALADEPSWGTAMEIFYAASHDMPVLLWTPRYSKSISPWLKHHSVFRSANADELMKFLKGL